MKLNGITCDGFAPRGKDVYEFSLSGTALVDAAALQSADLRLTEDDGETLVAAFDGYSATGVWASGESVRVRAARSLPDATAASIEAIEANMSVLSGKAEEAKTAAEAAGAKADEAAEAAAGAGTDPSVMAFARMAVLPMAADMTISEGASVAKLWPERKVGDVVELKDFFWFNGELYRCNQPELTITEGQTPDMNLPALYAHVDVADDGILVWDADDLTGAPDIYNTGVRVHYPDADGPVYVSGRDGNTSTPGTDQWWTLETETE